MAALGDMLSVGLGVIAVRRNFEKLGPLWGGLFEFSPVNTTTLNPNPPHSHSKHTSI